MRFASNFLTGVWQLRAVANESVFENLGGTLIVSNASWKDTVHKAVKEGTLSFGFSAGGCLFPYYIGVSGALRDGQILTANTKVGGSSAGSLLAVCLTSGMRLDDITEFSLRLMADCRLHGTRGRLGEVLARTLHKHLPEDAHTKVQGKAYDQAWRLRSLGLRRITAWDLQHGVGALQQTTCAICLEDWKHAEQIRKVCLIGVSKAFPMLQPMLLSEFQDREDLIAALLSSCHIPYWLDSSLFTEFRGIGISPDTFTPWPHSLASMVSWALEPADEATVVSLIDKGRADALAWMESMELGSQAESARTEGGEVGAAKEAARETPDGTGGRGQGGRQNPTL
ncbi:hypothetical protein F751_4819 [Auxenochlorella protothecoides]|uniref:Patatin n=1 Tax=Auxenochlorella protothecoides TaxID=3075 RepID=A0A087SKS2_AUXPR|nr:hypothetical protein F751_4819 [Auxenochlorella protothecoides]KFM26326.1 hypothetical protein F751_4819 [Auxenochlorella protothecoides]